MGDAHRARWVWVWISITALGASACSFSQSSGSISDSSGSSSRSSSSSSPGASENAYQEDVEDYARATAKSKGDFSQASQDLGRIAKDHGITNWEESDATWESLGKGLAQAEVSGGEFQAYASALAAGNQARIDQMQRAWKDAQ